MTGVEGNTGVQTEVLGDPVQETNCRRWLVVLALPHLGDNSIEVGSGLGHYAAERPEVCEARWTASEADQSRLAALKERFRGHQTVRVRKMSVPIDETAEHSSVVAYNGLEHISDDVAALRAFAGVPRPRGALVLVVPAFPSAMSRFDLQIGHKRGDRKRSLRAAVDAAGLRVEVLDHINCIGMLGRFVLIKGFRGRPHAGRALIAYDRGVVPWLRPAEAGVKPPLGQSLFLVAHKQ